MLLSITGTILPQAMATVDRLQIAGNRIQKRECAYHETTTTISTWNGRIEDALHCISKDESVNSFLLSLYGTGVDRRIAQ